MFGFAVPSRVWILLGLVLAGAAIASAGYGFGRFHESRSAAKELNQYKEEVREREREQARLLAEADDKNREQEKTHEQRVSDLRAEFAQQQADAQARDARTIAYLRSGAQQLRLQVTSCSTAQANSSGTASGGADGAGGAELAPEVAAALWSIAADGDRAIRKLTTLQGWARSAVQLCGVPQTEPKGE